MEHEFHPLADLFPLLGEAELNELADDILEHGQREPIWLYDGKILDGRNRYRACLLKGVNPHVMETRVADPAAFVASMNLHRRHLSEEQRGMIAARLATMKQGDNQHTPNGGTSRAKAAELLKVNKRRVERSHEVLEKGVPDLVDAVEHGDVAVSAAVEFANQNPPIDQQRLIVEHGSPAAAVKATTLKEKADRAASKPTKPKPNVALAADRAEQAAAAKHTAQHVIDAIDALNRIDVGAAIVRMSNDERTALLMQMVRANQWVNRTAIAIAISGGANVGVIAPPKLRLNVLEFLHTTAARIEAELAKRAVMESAE